MARMLKAILAGIVVVLALAPLGPAAAQKPGGVLKSSSSTARPPCRSTRNRPSPARVP